MDGASDRVSAELAELAAAHRVATQYTDAAGRTAHVPAATIAAVLDRLGVDVSSPEAVTASLRDVRLAPWRTLLPPTVVIRADRPATVIVHAPSGTTVDATVRAEDGSVHTAGP
jgi:4-alpha-glucanotransferase